MAKQVEYTNTCGQALYATFGKPTAGELGSLHPEVFDNSFDGQCVLSLADVIAMIFPGGDVNEKPYFYIRHTDMIKNEFRFGSLLELGDDFLSPQKGVMHADDFAKAGTKISSYHTVEDKKGFSGFGSENPASEFRFGETYYTCKEGTAFTVKAEHWPNAIYEHESMYNNVSTIIQAASYIGTYEGRRVMGLGEHDRLFIPTEVNGFDGITANFGYVYINMMGIREDGRREQALISLEDCGKIFAYYYIDGEQPILCDHVTMEADWYRLPYVDDGTCVYKDAVFRFAGKEFHFQGKWGSKGFGEKPRVEKHGQSQIFGTWYEGKTPYKHRLYMGFGENMEAFDYKLKEKGFDIVGEEK